MQPAPQATGHVDNNMVLAVVALFLFWPTAIAAVANATKVDGLAAQGDQQGAAFAAFQARKFALVSIVLGVAFWAVFCGVTGCGPVAGSG
jgi:hypothetical protein